MLGVLITFGALATDGPSTAPLILGALLWAAGMTGVIVFSIYRRASHDAPRGRWYRTWRSRRPARNRARHNGPITPRRPIPQA